MKHIFLILSSFFFVTGCSEENIIEQKNSIYGTWKLTETYGDMGDNNSGWTPVGSGFTYTFRSNGIYSSTRFSKCILGTYTMKKDTLTLDFGCDGFSLDSENYF